MSHRSDLNIKFTLFSASVPDNNHELIIGSAVLRSGYTSWWGNGSWRHRTIRLLCEWKDRYAPTHVGQVTTVPLLAEMNERLAQSVHPPPRRVKVAVIGSGLAGLAAAYLLSTTPQRTGIQYGKDEPVEFEVHIFEKVCSVQYASVMP